MWYHIKDIINITFFMCNIACFCYYVIIMQWRYRWACSHNLNKVFNKLLKTTCRYSMAAMVHRQRGKGPLLCECLVSPWICQNRLLWFKMLRTYSHLQITLLHCYAGWRVCDWLQRAHTSYCKRIWAHGSKWPTIPSTNHDLIFPSWTTSSSIKILSLFSVSIKYMWKFEEFHTIIH